MISFVITAMIIEKIIRGQKIPRPTLVENHFLGGLAKVSLAVKTEVSCFLFPRERLAADQVKVQHDLQQKSTFSFSRIQQQKAAEKMESRDI